MPAEEDRVEVHLDKLLADRGMSLTELSAQVGVTLANLSILKNGRARAIRFSTLTALCEALDCQPGDLLTIHRPARRGARQP
ncbi:helix-turn-helix transcriptional regulator [Phytohabitans sp. ZYX-F-186]|uniref:Helix-turn-helix transcriptional regulator n=1 Tax=Phytohabitans maris TaxID=3071409 RepID=A0ABU0ZD08_9ACTN|nr:helix-turn-helix transcriptional regulator [Phytohabitans sp. ZYX-F-186]MDQ7904953.1 helix-turn-helix transcriptional regulator [Phytohabitans sp. ZYX-F-186]